MKIPKKAKCVFRGVIFEMWQWEQKMFDGTFETFEMIKRSQTTQVIAIENDMILIAKEEQPTKPLFFSLFGGRVEKGETPLLGAKREFLEEAGMIGKNWELLKIYEPTTKMDWSIYLFVTRQVKKITEPKLDSGEKIEMMKVNFDQFIELILEQGCGGCELQCDILKMKLNGTLDEFRKKLFQK